MRARVKPHRFRALTRALLWYPAVCTLIAAAFAFVVWADCGSLKAVQRCRSEIAGETAWVFGIVLVIGSAVLGVLWLATAPFAARRTRGIADGFGRARAGSDVMPGRPREEDGAGSAYRPAPKSTDGANAADPVRPARAARHGSPKTGGSR
jgi:hypothetical protein